MNHIQAASFSRVPNSCEGSTASRKSGLTSFLSAFVVLVLAFFAPSMSHAQLSAGSLQGVVSDSTGAAVPGATISVTNASTAATVTATSNGNGEYRVGSLQPGIYSVTITHAGFKALKQDNVTIQVGESASLNETISIGEVSQTVEVATTSSAIANTDATLGTVVEQQQIVDLPLNGRQFSQLIQLEPGVVPIDNSQNAGKAPSFGGGGASPGVNGQTNRSNIFFLDGLIDSNPFFGGYSFSPSVDDIQEFKAESHTDQAEFGQATGAIVDVVTRPGTNTLHGSVFEFVRNTILNTQPKNFSGSAQPKIPYHLNQFGGSLGGPILKDKLFFFVNYEGGRQVTPTAQYSTVPTAAQRTGDFSGVIPGDPTTPTIYDPTTYNAVTHTISAFPGNKIPSGRIDAGMLAYLNGIYPLPNTTTATGINNYYTTLRNPVIGDQGSARVDYTIGQNDSILARYSQNQASVTSASSLADLFVTGFNGKNIGGTWTHTFSPTLVSQLTVGYNTLNIPQQIVLPISQDTLFASAGLGAGFPKNPGQTPFTLVPDMGLQNGNYSGFWNGAGPIGPMAITQYGLSVSKVVAAHTIKFGGSFYRTAMYTNWSGNHFDFSNEATWNPTTQQRTDGDPVASLLLSLPIDATRNLGNTGVNLRQIIPSAFVQDTWVVNPRLTVTYGVRWDYGSPVTETNNRLAVYNIYTHKYQIAQGDTDVPSGALPANVVYGPSNSITQAHNTYFQPRLGIAYAVTPKTTFRIGAGRTFDTWGLPLQVAQQDRGSWPSGVAQQASTQALNVAGVSLKPDNTPYTGENPFFGAAVLPASPLPAGGLGFQDVKWQPASSFQWNAEIQQSLGGVGSLRVAYVGSETEHQTINDPYNLAPAQPSATATKAYPDTIFGSPGSVLTSIGTSSYNSLQADLSRTYANGLVYNLSFTYSKSLALAICGGDFNTCVQNPYNLGADRGPTNLDLPLITTFNIGYQLPFGHGKDFVTSGPGALLLGGWQVNSIFSTHSGTVINPSNGANGDTANAGGGNQRVNFVGNPNAGAPHTLHAWFNPAAFSLPAAGTYGNASLNSLRGPGFWNVDFSLFRDIPIHERFKFQFRTEVFNLFNHPNLGSPNGSFSGSATSGGVTTYNGGFNTITGTTGTNRVIQLAGKILF
jgi:hypothetical protein